LGKARHGSLDAGERERVAGRRYWISGSGEQNEAKSENENWQPSTTVKSDRATKREEKP
jgi:hypothetical protein